VSYFKEFKAGGEGGIRTRHVSVDSASYRFHNATHAVNASDAVAPCTLLHASRLSTARLSEELAPARRLPYHGRTMGRKRAGRTVKVSVSLDVDDVAVLKRRARESYGGNLSAAFGEAARWIRQREARRRLVDMLGGPTLTPEMTADIDAEQAGRSGTRKTKRRTSAA